MAANVLADCQIITILVDTESTRRPTEEVLQAVFQLTKAEARLAAQLSSGEALDVAADKLNIAKETSRSQLKGIFAKTKVSRQAELVAVLSAFLHAESSHIHSFLDSL
jgi:DNA-binding CsgD family transcriptional regulator